MAVGNTAHGQKGKGEIQRHESPNNPYTCNVVLVEPKVVLVEAEVDTCNVVLVDAKVVLACGGCAWRVPRGPAETG